MKSPMTLHTDDATYAQAYMDTPFGFPKGATEVVPGMHTKSLEKGDDSFPKFFGIVVRYGGEPLEWTDAEVVVRSKVWSDTDPKQVWTGSKEDFRRMWVVD